MAEQSNGYLNNRPTEDEPRDPKFTPTAESHGFSPDLLWSGCRTAKSRRSRSESAKLSGATNTRDAMSTSTQVLFVADSMLGTLARYLRVMGYNTVYERNYSEQRLSELVAEGRVLLTRNRTRAPIYPHSIFIDRDLVKDQLEVIERTVRLRRDHSKWFNRCVACNEPLLKVKGEAAKENVPDYVFSKYPEKIRFCGSCRRFYWPGTHRQRMLERLKGWGF